MSMLCIPAAASANAGPAPSRLWMTFEYETAKPVSLEGIQLIACDTPGCEQPVLLQQYGNCFSPGCIQASPSLTLSQEPECRGSRCMMSFYPVSSEITEVKLVAQFEDGLRESRLFDGKLMHFRTTAWRVTVHDSGLTVSVDLGFRDPFEAYNSFFEYFAFTLAIELLIAALALGGLLKLDRVSIYKGLAYVLLVNIISYPVTWFFWPSLARFQPDGYRQAGYFFIASAAVFAALFVNISLAEGKTRLRRIIITVVLLLVVVFLSFIWLFVSLFGNYTIAVRGLPTSITIVLAETFAITFEAVLIYILARKALKVGLRRAVLISLVMNFSSYLLGKFVLALWL